MTVRAFCTASCAFILAVGLNSACSYPSEYVMPNDGRARTIFQDNKVVAVLPPNINMACQDAIDQRLLDQPTTSKPTAYIAHYYFYRQLAAETGEAPLFSKTQFPLFDRRLLGAKPYPPLTRRPAYKRDFVDWIGGGWLTDFKPELDSAGQTSTHLLLTWLALIPVFTIVATILPPGLWSSSSRESDRANIFNDLAREAGSACADPSREYIP